MLYKPVLQCNNHLSSCIYVKRWKASVIKVGVVDVDVHVLSHLKEELAWAVDKWLRIISTIK